MLWTYLAMGAQLTACFCLFLLALLSSTYCELHRITTQKTVLSAVYRYGRWKQERRWGGKTSLIQSCQYSVQLVFYYAHGKLKPINNSFSCVLWCWMSWWGSRGIKTEISDSGQPDRYLVRKWQKERKAFPGGAGDGNVDHHWIILLCCGLNRTEQDLILENSSAETVSSDRASELDN
jgi:hypothetical protein